MLAKFSVKEEGAGGNHLCDPSLHLALEVRNAHGSGPIIPHGGRGGLQRLGRRRGGRRGRPHLSATVTLPTRVPAKNATQLPSNDRAAYADGSLRLQLAVRWKWEPCDYR